MAILKFPRKASDYISGHSMNVIGRIEGQCHRDFDEVTEKHDVYVRNERGVLVQMSEQDASQLVDIINKELHLKMKINKVGFEIGFIDPFEKNRKSSYTVVCKFLEPQIPRGYSANITFEAAKGTNNYKKKKTT